MKFKLSAEVTVSAHTEVEADSLKEAIEIASERTIVIDPTGRSYDDEDQWVIDDADGEPLNIHLLS